MINYLLSVAELFLILLTINIMFKSKIINPIANAAIILTACILIIETQPILQHLIKEENVYYIVQILDLVFFAFLYVSIFHYGQWHWKLIWSAICVSLATFCTYSTLIIFNFPETKSPVAIWISIISRIFYIFFMVALTFVKKYDTNNRIASVTLLIVPILSVAIMLIFHTLIREPEKYLQKNHVSSQLFWTTPMLLMIIVAALLLYVHTKKQTERIVEQQTLIQQNELQQMHYQEIDSIYEKITAWRHEYHSHLQVLNGLCLSKKYDMILDYLKSIESTISDFDNTINSGNGLVDSLINAKTAYAKSNQIDVSVSVRIAAEISIELTDLASIIGNLFDNAIEACLRIRQDNVHKLFININISTIKSQLIIDIKNSSDGKFNKEGAEYFTTKSERYHGIGIKRIKAVVNKYSGNMELKYKNHVFSSHISLPLTAYRS